MPLNGDTKPYINRKKTANSSISTTPLKFEDVPEKNAFEYLQMIYIARN